MEDDSDSQNSPQPASPSVPGAVTPQLSGLTPFSSHSSIPPAEHHVPPAASPADAKAEERRRRWIKTRWIRWPIMLVVASSLALYVQDRLHGGLADEGLSNSGYAYSFKFYSHALPAKLKDGSARAYGHTALAFAEPTQDALVENCNDVGDGWSQAFTTTIGGVRRPVCTSTSGTEHLYVTNFSAFNTVHLFTITFYTDQKDAAKLSADTAKLQKMFDSVEVSRY